MRKLLKVSLYALTALVVIVVAGLGYANRAYTDALKIADPPGIVWADYVPIGGIAQWVQIRGQNRENPVVLWLNGGPGFTTIPQTLFAKGWEQDFTLVMWDQRGEGLTYAKSGQTVADTMTIDHMTDDGIAVAEFLRSKLGKQKIILLGHSWGSILGVHMVRKRPDLFQLYVGTGQVTSLKQAVATGYTMVQDAARSANNEKALADLEEVGPPPYAEIEKTWVPIKWANELDPRPQLTGRPSWAAIWALVGMASPTNLAGLQFSGERLLGQMLDDDIEGTSSSFDVPVVFIQGAGDMVTPTVLSKAYFEKIAAPYKAFHVIDGAGHLALMRNSRQFIDIVKAEVPRAVAMP
ncbi:MAG: alpha/beta hydrolase, partial [Rhodospirillaceae bacterium]|nr:alpha/beta hydrolase [Rhodospirillaceae bacterium]